MGRTLDDLLASRSEESRQRIQEMATELLLEVRIQALREELEVSQVELAKALGVSQPKAELFVCGGGAHNAPLLAELAALLPAWHIASTAELGLAPDWVEGAAFAWLAMCFVHRKPGNLPAVTGASRPAVLGAFYPS